ncbi:MAG: GGDEF domain-containing protein [Bradyrhizobiaceae bacterium]|nr:MAG: GGDEF domain-containing protein [Bradyrhizobiaceae bacterium]
MLDYSSLLIALSFCSAGLAVTFFVSWFVSRADHVLLTWGIGVSFLVASLLAYSEFVSHFSPPLGAFAFGAMLLGLIFFMGAGRQFRTGVLPLRTMAYAAALSIAAMATPMLQGYDGISYIVLNIAAMTILLATGLDYWRLRLDSPMLISTLAALYVLVGLSFLPCAILLAQNGEWVMHHAPVNWAEDINLAMCLTGIGSMGALSLGLNQIRLTQRHKLDAETDALTGLFNRRALIARTQNLPAPSAVVVFDIDHFKQVNDIHGHHTGDAVLQMFGDILAMAVRKNDMAARLGGEEFAVVLPGATAIVAALIAERVRQNFTDHRFTSAAGNFTNTVSAGIPHTVDEEIDLGVLLQQADTALYEAKREGRNRVIFFADKTSLVPMDGPHRTDFEPIRKSVKSG